MALCSVTAAQILGYRIASPKPSVPQRPRGGARRVVPAATHDTRWRVAAVKLKTGAHSVVSRVRLFFFSFLSLPLPLPLLLPNQGNEKFKLFIRWHLVGCFCFVFIFVFQAQELLQFGFLKTAMAHVL